MIAELAFETAPAFRSPGIDARALTRSPLNGDDHSTTRAGTVLLVDDDRLILNLLSIALNREGFSVLAASDGVEALELLAGHVGEVDLLVSDIVMPRMGGLELARAVLERAPDTKVLLMSGYFVPNSVAGDLPCGASFLQKPFGSSEVLGRVRELLSE